jgi:hypothetical protein
MECPLVAKKVTGKIRHIETLIINKCEQMDAFE